MRSQPTKAVALWLAVVVLGAPLAHAGDDAAIEAAGGTVRAVSGGVAVEFHLTHRELTDSQLECVAGRTDIVSLNLRDTKISDDGLQHLTGLTGLRRLHLERTAIGDITHLAGLEKLQYLNLYSTKVADTALPHLRRLKNLQQLFVWETAISEQACRQLQTALPGLKISRGVDLKAIAAAAAKKASEPAEPLVDLKWNPIAGSEPPVSKTGTFTTIFFENKRSHPVKLFWVQYGDGGLKFYADIGAGKTLKRNTFSEATWVITNESETRLGYFVSVLKPSKAVIPAE